MYIVQVTTHGTVDGEHYNGDRGIDDDVVGIILAEMVIGNDY